MIRKIHSLPRKASMEESWESWRGGAAQRVSGCHSPFLRQDPFRLSFREFIQLLCRGQAWRPKGAPKRWDKSRGPNKSLYEKIRRYRPQARVSERTVQRRSLRSSILKRGENGAPGFMSLALAHLTVQNVYSWRSAFFHRVIQESKSDYTLFSGQCSHELILQKVASPVLPGDI